MKRLVRDPAAFITSVIVCLWFLGIPALDCWRADLFSQEGARVVHYFARAWWWLPIVMAAPMQQGFRRLF